jgi:hypothetical protein
MTPRPLADALVEILSATEGAAADELRVTRVKLDLPFELLLVRTAEGEPVLHGELPRWRWRTGAEPPCARVRITFAENRA